MKIVKEKDRLNVFMTIRLNKTDIDQLNTITGQNKAIRSTIIRKLIKDYIKRQKNSKQAVNK